MSNSRAEALPAPFLSQQQNGSPSLVLSRRGARWIIPLDSRRVVAAGLLIYRPKSLVETLAWHGTRLVAIPRILSHRERDGVGLRGDLAAAFSRRLGRSDLRFAVAIPEADRATVAVIASKGQVLAFGKLATSEAATARVEREHRALSMVGPQLPPSVHAPKVLFRGAIGGVETLLQSPIGGWRTTASGRVPRTYVRALAALVRPGDEQPLGTLVPPSAPLDAEWTSLLSAISTRLARWEAVPVRTALVHGDFVPWNLIPHRVGLAAYDWEDAVEEGAPFWDLWHFAVQSGALLNRWSHKQLVEAAVRLRGSLGKAMRGYAQAAGLPADLAAPVLAAYLRASVTVVGRHGELDRPDRVHGLRYRARALAELLELWP